jgi:hypothetical protein
MKRILIVMLAVLVSGCATKGYLRSVSAGHVGCLPDEIVISDEETDLLAGTTWIATCKGRRFVCSSYRTGEKSGEVQCVEALQ